jgi:hypothetical protein
MVERLPVKLSQPSAKRRIETFWDNGEALIERWVIPWEPSLLGLGAMLSESLVKEGAVETRYQNTCVREDMVKI